MQEEKVKEALINIESELLYAKGELLRAEGITKSALLELEQVLRTIQNLFTPNDTHVCNCPESLLKERISTCGEKINRDYQPTQDPATIAQGLWGNLPLNE